MELANFESKYKICERDNVVGQGSFGFVFRYIDQETGEQVAVKIFGKADTNYLKIRKELDLWKNLCHENIVPVLDFCVDIKSGIKAVMPLARGNLRDFIEENCGKTLESMQLFGMTFMLLCGLFHLHQMKILHRDLKPENILYYEAGGKLNLKIADFSIAKVLEGTENTATFEAGTKRWMAPEILLGEEKTKKYSFKVDMWSLGLVLHDLITAGGYLAVTRPSDNWFLIITDEDIETIDDTDFWFGNQIFVEDRLTQELKKIIRRRMLVIRTDNRISSAEALQETEAALIRTRQQELEEEEMMSSYNPPGDLGAVEAQALQNIELSAEVSAYFSAKRKYKGERILANLLVIASCLALILSLCFVYHLFMSLIHRNEQ